MNLVLNTIQTLKVGNNIATKAYLGSTLAWELDQTWTLAVIPDTQRLARDNPTAFNNMVQWLVDNKDTEDIRMVMHLGDMVDDGGSTTEWSRADTALSRLHGEIPWITLAGNHDYDDDGAGSTYERDETNLANYFPASEWASYDWYIDEYNGVVSNQAATLTLGGVKYLFLSLEIFPRSAVLTWAENIITAQNPDRIILGTHMFLLPDGTPQEYGDSSGGGSPEFYSFCDYRTDADCTSGKDLYDNFISQHDNIILVMNGHDISATTPGEGWSRRTTTVNGNTINQHFFNYQNLSGNDRAWLRLYRFDQSDNTCDVETYNPVTDSNKTDSGNQFSISYN